MTKDDGGITTSNLIAAIAVVIMAFGAYWALMQSQFSNVEKTQTAAEQFSQYRDADLLKRIEKLELDTQRQAHEPVEKATLDAVNSAVNQRIDLIQAQIADINRQIAAALIIIDNDNGTTSKKSLPLPP